MAASGSTISSIDNTLREDYAPAIEELLKTSNELGGIIKQKVAQKSKFGGKNFRMNIPLEINRNWAVPHEAAGYERASQIESAAGAVGIPIAPPVRHAQTSPSRSAPARAEALRARPPIHRFPTAIRRQASRIATTTLVSGWRRHRRTRSLVQLHSRPCSIRRWRRRMS